jgi:hypothetical protein
MSKDAARVGRTCKALRVVAREHYRDLGRIFGVKKLQVALMTFPKARTVVLEHTFIGDEDRQALLDWLCEEEDRGRYLEEVPVESRIELVALRHITNTPEIPQALETPQKCLCGHCGRACGEF